MPVEKKKERQTAEDLFINQGWTGKAIANLLDVDEKTISNWRTKYEWDKQREEVLTSPLAIRKIILKEIKSVLGGNKPSVDADALAKLSKVNESLSDRINAAIVINVMQMLDEFSAEHEPKQAVANLDLHKRFILHVINLES